MIISPNRHVFLPLTERGNSLSRTFVHDQPTIKAHAAIAAFEKCFDTLAKEVDLGRVAPTLFARRVINSESLREARAINLLVTLLEKIRREPKVFHVICEVLEENALSAVTVLRGTKHMTSVKITTTCLVQITCKFKKER